MDWAVIGAMVGLAAVVIRGVLAFGMAGKEIGKLRVSGQSVRTLRAQAEARRWTWDAAAYEPTVPVGRLAGLAGLRQRGAAHGKFRRRQASAAVVAAIVDSGFTSHLGIDSGTTVLAVVITMEAPELDGDLHLDPQRGGGYDVSGSLAGLLAGTDLLNRLGWVGYPAVDVADGQASFLYPSLSSAAELDRLLSVGDDLLSGLAPVTPP
ncbi:hypothetical protein [Actinoplanes flavus]|uniref:Uncharacterized protein n=1 Tax=Actinoplanes flavus TaxID=2820290 RepID=A0ABS3UF07_9ACTN|nr:hypothetical protein [Actinoplanes flavus]MBO3737354.1 hypothetical protein [Actinoplanes flavus]